MEDDSWEESLSPDYSKKNKQNVSKKSYSPPAGSSITNQKLASLDNKYKFSSTTPTKSIKKTYSDDSIDKDILFSPTQTNSESGTPANSRKYHNFDDSMTPKETGDYLSNFVNTSGDLEDSILGELLGGNKRIVKPPSGSHSASTKSSRAQMKLEPLESAEKLRSPIDTNRNDSKGKRSSSPTQQSPLPPSASRGGRMSSPAHHTTTFPSKPTHAHHNSVDLNGSDDFSPLQSPEHPSRPSTGGGLHNRSDSGGSQIGGVMHTTSSFPDPFKKQGRPAAAGHQHHNSFDFGDFPPVSDLELSPKNGPGGHVNTHGKFNFSRSQSGGIAGGGNNNSGDDPPQSMGIASGGGAGVGVVSRSTNKVTYADEQRPSSAAAISTHAPAAAEEEQVDMGGFVPSFMEPGRQGRRRR